MKGGSTDANARVNVTGGPTGGVPLRHDRGERNGDLHDPGHVDGEHVHGRHGDDPGRDTSETGTFGASTGSPATIASHGDDRKLKRIREAKKGFTMVELLVVMPMLVILLGGLTLTLVNARFTRTARRRRRQRAFFAAGSGARGDQHACDRRSGLFVGDGTDPVLTATATSITFESPDRYPTTTNGTTESSLPAQAHVHAGERGAQEQLMTSTNTFPTAPPWAWPGTSGPWTTLVGSVTNTDVFTYYTAAGAQTTPADRARLPDRRRPGIRPSGSEARSPRARHTGRRPSR